ncbi:MAG TPA: hypothetical protein VH084_02360 [Mycobacterium sp.]|jgi:hypothetical protein|nr:hypothetical protein [Mycobacterium sp.]
MTVTAIQIGLDPDVIDYSSADFAQFPGLSKEKLRAATAQPGCRFVFNRGAVATPDDIRRWYPGPGAVA